VVEPGPPGHIDATAYFVVVEALTNVAKHSGATIATVTARHAARSHRRDQ
jgi:signal transduction histidine kinase